MYKSDPLGTILIFVNGIIKRFFCKNSTLILNPIFIAHFMWVLNLQKKYHHDRMQEKSEIENSKRI
jgi:hypothetical protein